MGMSEKYKQLLKDLKSGPCVDCNNSFPTCCMDFDHRDGEVKLGHIGQFLNDEKKLRIEIAKCDLVCANCHRIRTQKRGMSVETRRKMKEAWADPQVRANRLSKIRDGIRKSWANGRVSWRKGKKFVHA